jgi:hypothetical protein
MGKANKSNVIGLSVEQPSADFLKKEDSVLNSEVGKRAYEIYLSNGGATSDKDNWYQAEMELMGN